MTMALKKNITRETRAPIGERPWIGRVIEPRFMERVSLFPCLLGSKLR